MDLYVTYLKSLPPGAVPDCLIVATESLALRAIQVVLTTFVTITGHCFAYFCPLCPNINDKIVIEHWTHWQACQWLSKHNLVIKPRNHLQSCYWAPFLFTILSLSLGIIYNLVIEPCFFLFTILSLSLRAIYRAHLLLPDLGSGFICAWWQCILQFWGCCGLPQGLPTAYTSCGMYIVCTRGYIWIFWCFLWAWFQQK